jgi:hypothetical protein
MSDRSATCGDDLSPRLWQLSEIERSEHLFLSCHKLRTPKRQFATFALFLISFLAVLSAIFSSRGLLFFLCLKSTFPQNVGHVLISDRSS